MRSKEHHVPTYARQNVHELGDMMAATNIKRVLSLRKSVQCNTNPMLMKRGRENALYEMMVKDVVH